MCCCEDCIYYEVSDGDWYSPSEAYCKKGYYIDWYKEEDEEEDTCKDFSNQRIRYATAYEYNRR